MGVRGGVGEENLKWAPCPEWSEAGLPLSRRSKPELNSRVRRLPNCAMQVPPFLFFYELSIHVFLFIFLYGCFIPQGVLFPAGVSTHSIALAAALGRCVRRGDAAITVGSQSTLLSGLFRNAAPSTE